MDSLQVIRITTLLAAIAGIYIIIFEAKPAKGGGITEKSGCITGGEAISEGVDGEKLFVRHCSGCHDLYREKIGPPLASAAGEAPAGDWRFRFIRNPKSMIDQGDPYAVKIYNEYNKALMPAFSYLSDEEIKAILDYIEHPN